MSDLDATTPRVFLARHGKSTPPPWQKSPKNARRGESDCPDHELGGHHIRGDALDIKVVAN